MFKIIFLSFIISVYCHRINWSNNEIGNDKCFSDSDCNAGYYCKFIDNACIIEGPRAYICGYCTGKGL